MTTEPKNWTRYQEGSRAVTGSGVLLAQAPAAGAQPPGDFAARVSNSVLVAGLSDLKLI